jgi:hypothetical protein
VRLTNKEKKMTKFASVKKLIDLKRKQRHIIKSQRHYDSVNLYAFDLWIASVQVNKQKKKLRRV